MTDEELIKIAFAEDKTVADILRHIFELGVEKGRTDSELAGALIELGYPHNFQHERSDLVDYMYKLTEIIKMAYELK